MYKGKKNSRREKFKNIKMGENKYIQSNNTRDSPWIRHIEIKLSDKHFKRGKYLKVKVPYSIQQSSSIT